MSSHETWLAVSYLEWINWLARGTLRCHRGRIGVMASGHEQLCFDRLLSLAPDLDIASDDAFLLARLAPDRDRLPVDSPEGDWSVVNLDLANVECFTPLSDRGRRIVASDAERAGCRLDEPRFEALWQAWRQARLLQRAARRGILFTEALGLSHAGIPPDDRVNSFIGRGRSLLSEETYNKLRDTPALAWGCAFAAIREIVGSDRMESLKATHELNKVLGRLRDAGSASAPVLAGRNEARIAMAVSATLSGEFKTEVSTELLVVAFHYLELIDRGRPFDLPTLVRDLAAVYRYASPVQAAIAAYLIGQRMSDVAVLPLIYARDPDSYAAMSPRAELRFDVPSLAVEMPVLSRPESGLDDAAVALERAAAEASAGATGTEIVGAGPDTSATPSDAAAAATPTVGDIAPEVSEGLDNQRSGMPVIPPGETERTGPGRAGSGQIAPEQAHSAPPPRQGEIPLGDTAPGSEARLPFNPKGPKEGTSKGGGTARGSRQSRGRGGRKSEKNARKDPSE